MSWIFLLQLFLTTIHPMHVSKCQMEYRPNDSSLEVTLFIFGDDLEEIVMKSFHTDTLALGTDREHEKADSFIYRYILQHMDIRADTSDLQIDWKGKELDDSGVGFWFFLKAEDVKSINRLKIKYDILMDLYDDQKNILAVIVPGKKDKHYLFTPSNPSGVLKW